MLVEASLHQVLVVKNSLIFQGYKICQKGHLGENPFSKNTNQLSFVFVEYFISLLPV